MHIKLAYGNAAIPIDVPDNWINGRCIRPSKLPATGDARAELIAALSGLPDDLRLENILADKSSCTVVVDCEVPLVARELLPALVELIEDASTLASSDITILLANRLLEPLTEGDIDGVLDLALLAGHPIVLHQFDNETSLIRLGETSRRIPVLLNKAYTQADFKIIISAVRPDTFAGFSGARQTLLPGIAGRSTVNALFDFNNVADPHARLGNFRENPFHIAGLEALNMAGCNLAINAVMSPEGALHRITAGHFGQSHLSAMTMLREGMTVKVKEQMDIIVTSGGGAPYDATLFGILPTILAAKPVLKSDGTIVIAAALEGGLGPAEFVEALTAFGSVKEAMAACSSAQNLSPAYFYAQQFFGLLQDHEVIIHTKGLTDDEAWSVGLTPSRDMNEAVLGAMESHGQRCKIAALPEGPMGLPEIGS